MTQAKFHLENWRDYYNAKLDEEDLKSQIDGAYEGECTDIDDCGDTIYTSVGSSVNDVTYVTYEDDETGEEIEDEEVYYTAYYSYNVKYQVSDDLSYYMEDIERALNDAIESGQSTFEIEVPYTAVDTYDVEIDGIWNESDVEVSESDLWDAAKEDILGGLDEPTDARHNGDCIQPASDKEMRFICTIPAE